MKKQALNLFVGATLCSLFFAPCSSSAQVPSYVPTNGLVGWWPFNGNANDESGNGNNCSMNGPILTTDRFGIVNRAYSFDGINDIGTFVSNSNFNLTNSITISCWSAPQVNIDNQQMVWFGDNQTGTDPYSLAFNTTNKYLFRRDVSNGTIINQALSNTINNLNNYNHIVGSYNSSINKMYLYLNGQLVDSINVQFPIQCTTSNMYLNLGAANNGTQQFYKGNLDDIGIWNRALTQQEITALYQGCNVIANASPTAAITATGTNAQFSTSTISGASYQWQSNPANYGWSNVPNNASYTGGASNTLTVSNVQLANHLQPFRVIATDGTCSDTSNAAYIKVADTCITNITVTDTLIINTTLSLPAPNNQNTILIYPNPASDHITIDNGNYATMAGYSIKIDNNAGQQVFQSTIIQAQFYVDLNTWSGNGLYFVYLIDPSGTTVTIRKIVLQ